MRATQRIKTHPLVARCSATPWDPALLHSAAGSAGLQAERRLWQRPARGWCGGSAMKGLWLLLTTLLLPAHLGAAWPPNYAVDCPLPCDSNQCKSSQRCKRTVLDDCGCCRVCAAELGQRCYRTVAGMDGAKCGPGLRCHFSNQEDVFGEEFGICKECPYGTYGMDCKETCKCLYGICDRVSGKCLKFPFFQPSHWRTTSSSDHDMASGDGNAVKEQVGKKNAIHRPAMKWLNPR